MDVDPNYDPSDFLKLASAIKVEQPDRDAQPLDLYDDHQAAMQQEPHQQLMVSADGQYQYAYDQQQPQHHQDVYHQQHAAEQIALGVVDQQHDFMQMQYQQQPQQQQPPHQDILSMAGAGMSFQDMDDDMPGGVQQQHQQPLLEMKPTLELGVGIDDDLAVSDSDEEELNVPPDANADQFDMTAEPMVVMNAAAVGDDLQQSGAAMVEQLEFKQEHGTAPEPMAPQPPPAVASEVDGDDDGLWF